MILSANSFSSYNTTVRQCTGESAEEVRSGVSFDQFLRIALILVLELLVHVGHLLLPFLFLSTQLEPFDVVANGFHGFPVVVDSVESQIVRR